MKPPQAYRGNEQTYIKHYFLEKYLERFAYNILSFSNDLIYVDGFSGPWKSKDESYEDTSFAIAINKLREVRDAKRKRGQTVYPSCIFVERKPDSFAELEQAVSRISDLRVKAINSDFESAIPEIVHEVGESFAFTFIDHTGWKGFGLRQIQPLIKKKGEVLVNFMFDYINRFAQHPDRATAETFNSLYGDDEWYDSFAGYVDEGTTREDALVAVYMDRLRLAGNFKHVTCTRIQKPLVDRSYFYLVYGTRHWKGIQEFRKVEEEVAQEQGRVFRAARQQSKLAKTGQDDLFASANISEPNLPFEQQRARKLQLGRRSLFSVLSAQEEVSYESLLGEVLETPLVWARDLNSWLTELRTKGAIRVDGLEGRQRVPKPGYLVRRLCTKDRLQQFL